LYKEFEGTLLPPLLVNLEEFESYDETQQAALGYFEDILDDDDDVNQTDPESEVMDASLLLSAVSGEAVLAVEMLLQQPGVWSTRPTRREPQRSDLQRAKDTGGWSSCF
jgi:hypothetical protein